MEDNLRRSLIVYNGSISFMWERDITLIINIISAGFLSLPLIRTVKGRMFRKTV